MLLPIPVHILLLLSTEVFLSVSWKMVYGCEEPEMLGLWVSKQLSQDFLLFAGRSVAVQDSVGRHGRGQESDV